MSNYTSKVSMRLEEYDRLQSELREWRAWAKEVTWILECPGEEGPTIAFDLRKIANKTLGRVVQALDGVYSTGQRDYTVDIYQTTDLYKEIEL